MKIALRILIAILVITVFLDIMRNRNLSGWGKALWAIGIIILPFLGILVYLIARGGKMTERNLAQAAEQQRVDLQAP